MSLVKQTAAAPVERAATEKQIKPWP